MAKSAVLGKAQVKHLFKTVNHDVYFLSGKGVADRLGLLYVIGLGMTSHHQK